MRKYLLASAIYFMPQGALVPGRRLGRDPCCAVAGATLLLIPMLHGDTLDFTARGQQSVDTSKPPRQRWASQFSRSGEIRAVEFFDECGWHCAPQYFITTMPRILK